MDKSSEPIGPLQLRVMKHIWRNGSSTVHDVHGALNTDVNRTPLAYTTILTVMRNLANRKLLIQSMGGGRSHLFTPTSARSDYTKKQVIAMLRDLFDGDKATFIANITDIE